jgi:hypothetical protein
MPIKKLGALFCMTFILAFNGIGSLDASADTDLVERTERAKALYSVEEILLLKEKAGLIRANYENIFPMEVEFILNESMNFKFDTPPVIKDGRTLVPVRTISEAFEASVEWNPDERKVIVRKDKKEILIWIGETGVSVNGEQGEIDVPALILNGRAMVPLRFITENLGLTIQYHERYGIVEIVE